MKSRRISIILAGVAALFIAGSCKNKEEETTSKYLDAYPYFTVDAYLQPGSEVTLVPKQVTKPEGVESFGYSWKVSTLMAAADTVDFEDGHFTYKFDKDTVGTFTITCTVFATGYYTSSASASVTLVKPGLVGGSITGISEDEADDTYYDERDKTNYSVRTVNGNNWLMQNLAYAGTEENPVGIAYRECDAMSNVFGRYYTWTEAQTACPSGWRLPTEAEWMAAAQSVTTQTLESDKAWAGVSGSFMTYAAFNGTDFWEYWPAVKVDNRTGLCALSTGWCNRADNSFQGITTTSAFWTSDTNSADSSQGIYRYILADKPDMYKGAGDKESFGASVRCIED